MSTAIATATRASTAIEEKTATVAIKAKIDRIRELRVIKSDAEKEAKALAAEVVAWAGAGVKRITWGKSKLASLIAKTHRHADMGILIEAFPEAYEASLIESAYIELR